MGVELDSPIGKNDGSVNDVRYFKCRPNCGLFVAQSKIRRAGALNANITPVSSGAESADYGSGSISLGASGSSEVDGSSPSPYTSPSAARKKMGAASASSSR